MRPLRGGDLVALTLVLLAAAIPRAWYVLAATDGGALAPRYVVQGQRAHAGLHQPAAPREGGPTTELDSLARYWAEHGSFGGAAPLAEEAELTAHVAPAYHVLVGILHGSNLDAPRVLRWLQVALGTLTAVFLFFFTRRAFQQTHIGCLAGLLAAVHPFWILNTAELADGVLTTFLLTGALAIGARASQAGGALSSLVFGLTLAGLALVRAALLPFGVVALLWFLLRCRKLRAGWFCALLAFLGFANGLAPWTVRNLREFGELIPVADSACLHLWIGNNPLATGGPMDEATLRASFPPERLKELLAEKNQATRYAMLGKDVAEHVAEDPSAALGRRLSAGTMFVLGQHWFTQGTLAATDPAGDEAGTPALVAEVGEGALRLSLLALLLLGVLGWRFSFGWRRRSRLAALAAVALPLPYLLTHAELLSGPRLPWDAALIVYAAFAIACCLPGTVREPAEVR